MPEACHTLPGLRGDDGEGGGAPRPRATGTGPQWYPRAARRPISCNFNAGRMGRIRTFTPHCQVGNGSLFRLFGDPAREASTHLWLSKDGHFEQYVSFRDKAWAAGPGNPHSISAEVEGFPHEPYTPAQLRGLAEFFIWGAEWWAWPYRVEAAPGAGGISAHRLYMRTACPGELRLGQAAEVLALAAALAGPGRYGGMPTLRRSVAGHARETRELQDAINIILGHEDAADPGRLDPDGVYGPATQAAVQALQELDRPPAGPLAGDGICGPLTWSKAGVLLTAMGRVVGLP